MRASWSHSRMSFSPLLIGSCLDGVDEDGALADYLGFSPLLIGSCLDGTAAPSFRRDASRVSVPYSSGVALTAAVSE